VRGIAICKELSRYLELHLFNNESSGRSTIRLKSSGSDLTSSRVRSAHDATVLRERGAETRIYQLQGNLTFSSAELLVREVMSSCAGVNSLVLDFRRVLTINESACRFIYRLLLKLQSKRIRIVLVSSAHLSLLKRYMKAKFGTGFEAAYLTYDDIDLALEWCENRILQGDSGATSFFTRSPIQDYEFFEGLTAAQLQVLKPLLKRKKFSGGEVVIESGDSADHLFFLARGSVSVVVERENGAVRRLATFSPGMAFGELAVLDRAPRSARIVADNDVECDLMTVADFDRLDGHRPEIKIALLRNLALSLCQKLRKANRQITALE
jgi:glutaminase